MVATAPQRPGRTRRLGNVRRIAPSRDAVFRRRGRPHRVVADRVVLARPGSGEAIALDPASSVVWRFLDDWRRADECAEALAQAFPAVADGERAAALDAMLELLSKEGLVDSVEP